MTLDQYLAEGDALAGRATPGVWRRKAKGVDTIVCETPWRDYNDDGCVYTDVNSGRASSYKFDADFIADSHQRVVVYAKVIRELMDVLGRTMAQGPTGEALIVYSAVADIRRRFAAGEFHAE